MKQQKYLTEKRAARILADMKPLREMLSDWREELKLTPAEAARRCEMSPQLYWQLEHTERPDPRATTLLKLSKGTGLPMERLAVAATFEPLVAASA